MAAFHSDFWVAAAAAAPVLALAHFLAMGRHLWASEVTVTELRTRHERDKADISAITNDMNAAIVAGDVTAADPLRDRVDALKSRVEATGAKLLAGKRATTWATVATLTATICGVASTLAFTLALGSLANDRDEALTVAWIALDVAMTGLIVQPVLAFQTRAALAGGGLIVPDLDG